MIENVDLTELDAEAVHDLVLCELIGDAHGTTSSILNCFTNKHPVSLHDMQDSFDLLNALNRVIKFYGGAEVKLPTMFEIETALKGASHE